MKKKIVFLLFIVSMFLLNTKVYAESRVVNCPDSVIVNNNFVCTVQILGTDPAYLKTDGTITIETIGDTRNRLDSDDTAYFEYTDIVTMAATEVGTKTISLYEPGEPLVLIGSDNIVVNAVTTTTAKTTTTTTTTTTTKEQSKNNYLSNLIIDGTKIEKFSKNKTEYTVEVGNDVVSIVIDAKAEDEKSTVDLDGPSLLEEGENEFIITVTAEDGTKKEYKITIIRLEKEDVSTSSTKLTNIKIKGYDFKFNKNSRTFYINIKNNVSSLDIDVESEDEEASIIVSGNEELENNSIIKIVVSKDGEKDTIYRIIIEKEESTKKSILPYMIAGGSALLIAIIIFIILIKGKKKNKKKKKLEKKEEIIEEELHVDNDEEEKTRSLKFDSLDDEEKEDIEEELEKTKIIDIDNINENKED